MLCGQKRKMSLVLVQFHNTAIVLVMCSKWKLDFEFWDAWLLLKRNDCKVVLCTCDKAAAYQLSSSYSSRQTCLRSPFCSRPSWAAYLRPRSESNAWFTYKDASIQWSKFELDDTVKMNATLLFERQLWAESACSGRQALKSVQISPEQLN